MTRRYYSSVASETQLTAGINETTTSILVSRLDGYPTLYPYVVIVDDGTTTEEAMLVTAASGTTLTVQRGFDGTTAYAHTTGASVKHAATAIEFREANQYINTAKTWGNLKDGS